MSKIPMPQQIYRHFKGNLYQIVSLAEHTETGEKLVIYQALYGTFQVYARPLSMFMEKVDKQKYPSVSQEYRFELQTDLKKEAEVQKQEIVREPEENTIDITNKTEDTDNTWEKDVDIDPLVLEFLDAKSHEERLNTLAALHHRITDEMINTMAIVMDVEIPEGDLEERYMQLRQSLLLLDKFEVSRLR